MDLAGRVWSCLVGPTLVALAFALGPAVAHAQAPQPPAPLPAPLPLFPPDNWWNVDVSAAPLDSNSTNFINFIGGGVSLHPDFGGDAGGNDIYGMVYVVVPGTQPLEPVTFVEFGDESDAGAPGRPPGYPIPLGARTQPKWIEGGNPGGCSGNDDHMLLVDRDNRILFELYHTCWQTASGPPHWEAGSGAIYQLDGNGRRPEGWTSADAAGLAILPGLVRYDEVFGPDPIRHAFRFTVQNTNGHVYPASHTAGSTSGALPMGARLRLKASKDISGLPASLQKIFQAMKTYGLIVADNGTNMYVTGAYDPRWDSPEVGPTWPLTASDFEVVERGWQPPVTLGGATNLFTLAPCRLLDTRLAPNQVPPGPYGGPAVPPSSDRVLVAAGRCGIPSTAKAIALNVTAVNVPAAGYLSLFPGDVAAPFTSALNFSTGQTRANNAVVKVASSGSGAIAVRNGMLGQSVHVVVDVFGYFQ